MHRSNDVAVARFFDHLVGASEQRGWDSEAKRFSRLKIDNQFVFRRRLHRKVGRLLALEDTINVNSRAPALVDQIGSL
jgi:hypothetical protein